MISKDLKLKAKDLPGGVITSIAYQKRDKQRASLFVDGEFAVGINVSTIENFRLRKGDEMTSILAEKLADFDNRVSARRIATKFINTRRRSEREVAQKLKGYDFDKEIIEEVTTSLKAIGLIDDLAFARSFIHDKLIGKPHSAKRLELDLKKKGIAKDVTAEALKEVAGDESEEDRAYKTAEKKWQQLERRETDIKKRKQKLFTFLASRGFAFDVIRIVITKLSTDNDDEFDNA